MNNTQFNHPDDGMPPAELGFLRAVTAEAPPFSSQLFANALATEVLPQPGAKIIKPNFGWWKKAAAAAVLVLIAGAVFYKWQQKNAGVDLAVNSTASPNKNGESKSNDIQPAIEPIDVSNSANDSNSQTKQLDKHLSGNYLYRVRESKAKLVNNAKANTADKGALAFAGTDVLYKLVNYKYQDAEQFMAALNASPQRRISIDRYSYINVSEKMNDLLQRMYETKQSGKPTGKARRTRKRLEKWKKADAEYFDKKLSKNPLDIVDLSEFILK